MFKPSRRFVCAMGVALPFVLAACGGSNDDNSEAARATEPMPTPNAQMQAVLNALAALGAKPVHTLTVAQARAQATPADAVRSVLTKQGKSTAPEAVGSVTDSTIAGPAGPIAIRIYKPAGVGPFPLALFHPRGRLGDRRHQRL